MARLAPRTLLALSGAALAAACSDPNTAPNATERSPSAPSFELGANDPSIIRHVMPMHELTARGGLYTGSVTGGKIFNRGGPVLQAGTKVAAIYWAPSGSQPIYVGAPTSASGAGSGDVSLIGKFLRALNGSAYFNINTSYTDASGRKIVNSVQYTQFWVNTTNAPSGTASVSDTQMLAMLSDGFTSGALTYDPNTLYVIFTAGQVNLGGGFGTQYCAYHTHGNVTTKSGTQVALYSAMPYNASNSGCLAQAKGPNYDADPGVDPEVSVLAHEIEETTTDMMANAWYDNRGYENADKCAWTWGTTQTVSVAGGTATAAYNMSMGGYNWLVQRNWSATANGCLTGA